MRLLSEQFVSTYFDCLTRRSSASLGSPLSRHDFLSCTLNSTHVEGLMFPAGAANCRMTRPSHCAEKRSRNPVSNHRLNVVIYSTPIVGSITECYVTLLSCCRMVQVWELFYPCLFCLFCTCYLVVFKTYIERLTPKEAATDGRLRDPEGKAVALLSSRENSSSSFKAEGGDDWTMRDS